MKDYVVQSGPLRTFDRVYDDRLEKIRAVGDYHTIELIPRPDTQRRIIAEMKRSSARESRFVSAFFSAVAEDHRTIFGMRDVSPGHATLLAKELGAQKRLRWSSVKFGISEEDLVLVELRDFAGDFALLDGFIPPSAGDMFFCLTAAPFDVFDVYWQRSAKASLKARDDRFRREVVALTAKAKVTLYQDQYGAYTVVLNPELADVAAVEKKLTDAGVEAGISITFAPGLFG